MPNLILYPCLQRAKSEYRTSSLGATRGILYKRNYFPTYVTLSTPILPFSLAHICLVGTTGVRVLRERDGSFVTFVSLAIYHTVFFCVLCFSCDIPPAQKNAPNSSDRWLDMAMGEGPGGLVGGLGFVTTAVVLILAPFLRSYLSSSKPDCSSLAVTALGTASTSDCCFNLSDNEGVCPNSSSTIHGCPVMSKGHMFM